MVEEIGFGIVRNCDLTKMSKDDLSKRVIEEKAIIWYGLYFAAYSTTCK